MKKVVLIAAMAKNRAIGHEGIIPWRLPADLERFAELTRRHSVIMGRITLESIGEALKDRHNIVITSKGAYRADGCTTVGSFEEALVVARTTEKDKIFVIGGAQIYELALPYADEILLTVIDEDFEGDTFFPEFDEAEWELAERVPHKKDAQNPYNFEFLRYVRRKPKTDAHQQ